MNKKYEAIIVLSNLMDKFGTLNHESKKRSLKAVELFRDNPKSFMITSGWAYRDDSNLTIAEALKNHLVKFHSIQKENIICEKNSRDTVGDAVFTRLNIISRFNIKKIAVVTSNYHKKRSQEIFEFVYGKSAEIKIIPTENQKSSNFSNQNYSEEISLNKFRETFYGISKGDLNSIYKRLMIEHPYYNGLKYNF